MATLFLTPKSFRTRRIWLTLGSFLLLALFAPPALLALFALPALLALAEEDKNGNTQLTSWWQGKNIAGIIDFTNDEAVSWWTGLLGYPFVLPDMVGGNAYEGKPSPELFVRWVQANTFMPSIQFSLLPWQFENQSINVSKISLEVSSLHSRFAPLLIDVAKKTLLGKGPIVRPTWWLCPMDEECLLADQQFLVGDDLLVTPVVIEAATSLDVVFPPGKWKRSDGDGQIYEGVSKQTLYDISIESNIYFERI
ncbi:putative family 31 glucosidase [Armadillidium vulgare]|nr:putative family 31 glucosidase [Armadillidium vulgare]